MANVTSTSAAGVALGTAISDDGVAAINFFNGRLLTGTDLSREQTARRLADQRVGQLRGSGVAWGLEVMALGSAAPNRVHVHAGLGVTPCGQVLKLAADTVVHLVASSAETAAQTAGDFGACGTLGAGTYVAGDGLYMLTLAPALAAEGKAPVLALEAVNQRCSTDVWVESVQLRLLELDGWTVDGSDFGAQSRLRNRVANSILGSAAMAGVHARPGVAPADDHLASMAGASLTPRDLPLALIYRIGSNVQFVDTWAVRRRLAADAASAPWAAWIGEQVQAQAEARLLQFQAQLAESGALLLANAARANLDWLPPAGFLPPETNWAVFLGARSGAPAMPLAPSDAPDLLASALRGEAVELSNLADETRFRVYRIDGDGWLLFVRDARNVHAAEQVWLDGPRSGMPRAKNVQSAIDGLRAGTCLHMVLWPDMKQDEMQRRLGTLAGQDASVTFEPGIYSLDSALKVQGSLRVWIRGPGAVLINPKGGPALLVTDCLAADVRDLSLQARSANDSGGDPAITIPGTLTIIGTPSVYLEGIDAACDRSQGRPAACIVADLPVRDSIAGAASRVEMRSCHARAGQDVQGLVSLNALSVRIRDNRVDATEPAACAIEVTGTVVARDVIVSGNTARRVSSGVRIIGSGTSAAETAEQVVVEANRVELVAKGGTKEADRCGILVGDVVAARVTGNQVIVVAGTADDTWQGLRLTGIFGPQLAVRDNLTAGFRRGIEFRPKTRPSFAAWSFDGNTSLRGATIAIDLPADLRNSVGTEAGPVHLGFNRPMVSPSEAPMPPSSEVIARKEWNSATLTKLDPWLVDVIKLNQYVPMPGAQLKFDWRGGDATLSFGPFDLVLEVGDLGKVPPSFEVRFVLSDTRRLVTEPIGIMAGTDRMVEALADNLPKGLYSLLMEVHVSVPPTTRFAYKLRGNPQLQVST